MNKRKMNIVVNEEDVRKIVIKCVELCLENFNKKHNESIHKLSNALENGTPLDIQNCLNSILNNCNELGTDFSDAMGAVLCLNLSVPDTEVVEDLLDLEKDSLTVNSRSK